MKFSVEFLGTGTSVGIPFIGCDCPVCCSDNPHNQRLRCSALVRAGDTAVVIDTGPDFRTQMLRARVKRLDAVIITHFHADHITGIDDVRAFNMHQSTVLDMWGRADVLERMQHSFGYVFSDTYRPGLPNLRARPTAPGERFAIGPLRFEPIDLDHGRSMSLGFKISTDDRGPVLAWCLDCKRIPDESIAALQGVDVLVLDMLREKEHPTHMCLAESLAAVEAISPGRTWFSHMTHDVDHATMNAQLPEGIQLAYDGLVLELD